MGLIESLNTLFELAANIGILAGLCGLLPRTDQRRHRRSEDDAN